MTRYAALIRGINVGGKKKLPMADLRGLLTDLGYTDVATLLQSGNAVFTAGRARPASVEKAIRAAIAERLGLDVGCMVRSAGEIRAVVAAHPLHDVATDGSKLIVHFLSAEPDPDAVAADDPATLDPTIVRGKRVVYQWCPEGLLAAPAIGPFIEKRLGVAVTARNWNTVCKLDTMLAQGKSS